MSQVAGKPKVRWRTYGKPNPEPYELAMASLTMQADALSSSQSAAPAFSNIYMVGGLLSKKLLLFSIHGQTISS